MTVSVDTLTQIVAIDGPAGAGKSTVARRVAERLGFAFLDTGAMYRAATWWALEQGVDLEDPEALAANTRAMPFEMYEQDGQQVVRVNNRDITDDIRTQEVTRQIHWLDHVADVRAHLVALQQQVGAQGPTVAEGRDMGTVVFPASRCKIYLDASVEERANRRTQELASRGVAADIAAVRADIEARDHKDMTRDIAPLQCADDAILVDTTGLTIDAVVDRIVTLAEARL